MGFRRWTRRVLTYFSRYPCRQGCVSFRVDFRRAGLGMAEQNLSSFQTVILAELRGGRMPQSVRRPAAEQSDIWIDIMAGFNGLLLHRAVELVACSLDGFAE